MKICIVQPKYSTDSSLADSYFKWETETFDKCDDSMDLIVFPESCDVPVYAQSNEEFQNIYIKYNKLIIEKAKQTAKRCNAIVCFNAIREVETGLRNTTYLINRNGDIAGYYYKQHLTPNETSERGLDSEYTFVHSEPTILELDGLRFAFLTCYDFYFYESFSNIARYEPDIILGCSHQRTDTHRALEIMSAFCAYNCNAYVVRSSVSMDETSDIGGASLVAAPDGQILLNMKSRVGMDTVEIDPHWKYLKPMGYPNPVGPHYKYIEKGRRPWKYRPGGSAICKYDSLMPYPRICAHRGFNTIAPENSLPAYGAAVAMGADEIEFDLWNTKDGEIVSIHDSKLERVSNGTGRVYEKTYTELLQYDFGSKVNEKFKDMKIPTFEEILKKFACHTIMNIHLKSINNSIKYDEVQLKKILALIEKYDCKKYVYFMSGNDAILEQLQKLAPEYIRCCGAGDAPWEIVDRAIKYGCQKVQLFKPYFDQKMIDKAHANGIVCNLFWSDDVQESQKYIDMGIDTILTNDYWLIANAIKNK